MSFLRSARPRPDRPGVARPGRGGTGGRRLVRLGGLGLAVALVAAGSPVAGATPSGARHDYIVLTKTYATTPTLTGRMSAQSIASTRVLKRVFPGFTASLSAAEVVALRHDPGVRSVVPDTEVHAADVHAAASATRTTQTDAPWGLDRIDQRSKKLDRKYTYDSDGTRALAIVLDTGIAKTNTDFRGRVLTGGYDYVDRDEDPADCNGHGTHVSGTIMGTRFGVAKKADVLPLRILDCNGDGTAIDTIQALDDVAYSAPDLRPAVVNMSLGGTPSREVDAAVNAVVAAGIPVVVAAGNAYPGRSATSACTGSPGRVPNALTVGATGRNDGRAGFSNFGPCVDIWAPGVGVESDWKGGKTATKVESGTSMAAPHVAGAVARFLGVHPTATPAQVRAALVASATPAAVTRTAGSPQVILFGHLYVPPTRPQKVSVSASAASVALSLRWAPPASSGGSAIRAYEVRRTGTDAKGRRFTPTTVSSSARSYRFSGLRAATAYTMSVTPANRAVRGPYAAAHATTVTRPGRARVLAPRPGATTDKATSVTARWRPPASGGKVTRYSVSYRRAGTGSYTAVRVASTRTSLEIGGLRRGARYVVVVRAGNAAGWGAVSARSAAATAR